MACFQVPLQVQLDRPSNNSKSQIGHDEKYSFPEMKSAPSIQARYIACGSFYTAVLTCTHAYSRVLIACLLDAHLNCLSAVDGNVYTFGNGAHGKLGHPAPAPGSSQYPHEYQPRLVQSLIGRGVTRIACAQDKMIAFTGINLCTTDTVFNILLNITL